MTTWRTAPEIDDRGRVGLNLINVVYGAVLAEVFLPTAKGFFRITLAGQLHLVLAATVIVVSWIGYYNNRDVNPLWKAKFFNFPLWQYLLSVIMLAAYWGLAVTAEGVPDDRGVLSGHPSARPEAVLIFAIFGMYLVWDCLEIKVQEDDRYASVACYCLQPPRAGEVTLGRRRHRPFTRPDGCWYAARARANRFVTGLFMTIYLATGLVIWTTGNDLQTQRWAVAFDAGYIISVFFYRYAQMWWYANYVHPPELSDEHKDSCPQAIPERLRQLAQGR